MTINQNGWLESSGLPKISSKETPNTSRRFNDGLPDTIVIHFTGGRSAESSANWLVNPEAKASAHVVVDKDGSIIQLADFHTICWHAGKSKWKDRNGLNRYSIGIEIDNAGRLEKRAQGYFTWFKTKVKEEEVVEATHRNEDTPTFWQAFTEAQVDKVEQLCQLLIQTYSIKEIVGHEEISPGRKVDPGPAFPLDKLRNQLLNGRRESDEQESDSPAISKGIVTASKLNIRELPTTNSLKVAEPLSAGTIVSIEQEQAGWYKVKTEIEGWVSGEYLAKQ